MKLDELRGARLLGALLSGVLLPAPLPIREFVAFEPAEALRLPDCRLVPWFGGENERIEFAPPPNDLLPNELLPDDLLPDEFPPRRSLPLFADPFTEPALNDRVEGVLRDDESARLRAELPLRKLFPPPP